MTEPTMDQAGLLTTAERDRINRYVAAELLTWAELMHPGPDKPGMAGTATAAWSARRFWADRLHSRAKELSPPNPDDQTVIEARLGELRGEQG